MGPGIRKAYNQWLNRWWFIQGVLINPAKVTSTVMSDASLTGWWAVLLPQGFVASGVWNQSQKQNHINVLELQAVVLALRQFLPWIKGHHVMIRTVNSTVAAYIRKQGGTKSPQLAMEVWKLLSWYQNHNITLSVTHITGTLNVWAIALSRTKQIVTTE